MFVEYNAVDNNRSCSSKNSRWTATARLIVLLYWSALQVLRHAVCSSKHQSIIAPVVVSTAAKKSAL